MRYYIVDDEIGIVKALENIIESRGLGEVTGYQTDPEKAAGEIAVLRPDIVLVDLLMGGMDGISLVEQLSSSHQNLHFVMISRVTDKAMVEQAYRAGVNFFIHKPVNLIEVETVLNNVAEKVHMSQMVSNIRRMFAEEDSGALRQAKGCNRTGMQSVDEDSLKEINTFLGLLGMAGEKGTADILSICSRLIAQGGEYSKEILNSVAEERGDTPRNMEQRMRRAIKKGLTNVASLGLDDYSNEVFQVYANYVFDFRNIKEEMDYIKGSNSGGGRVSITKFVDGLLLYRKSLK